MQPLSRSAARPAPPPPAGCRPAAAVWQLPPPPAAAARCCRAAARQPRAVATAAKKLDAASAVAGLRSAMAGSSEPAHAAAADFLRSVGFTSPAELARVLDIATNPNSLFVSYNDPKRSKNASARPLDVAADLRPVVSFLSSRGLGSADIIKARARARSCGPRPAAGCALRPPLTRSHGPPPPPALPACRRQVISGHPPVLSYSVTGRLEPFWDYLAGIGVADVGAVLVARPSLLGLDVHKNLEKIIGYLRSVETPPELVVKYLIESL
jgi:hypothetical protein